MLKWAVGKDDRPINSTKSLKKRRKLQVDMQSGGDASSHRHVELISGCCKHRPSNNNNHSKNALYHGGPSRFLHKSSPHHVGINDKRSQESLAEVEDEGDPPDNNNSTFFQPNYQKKDGEERLHIPNNLTTSNNNNNIINSDSKSLLYMSLDHLPMAIVKQYERMLQDAPLKPPPQSILKTRHSPSSNNHSNSCNNSSNRNKNPSHHNRPSTIRIQNQNNFTSSVSRPGSSSDPCKKSLPKSVRMQEHCGDTDQKSKSKINASHPSPSRSSINSICIPKSVSNLEVRNVSCSNTPIYLSSSSKKNRNIHNSSTSSSSHLISIKEATNRPLKVLSVPDPNRDKSDTRKILSSSIAEDIINEKCSQNSEVPKGNNSTQVISKANSLETKTNTEIPEAPLNIPTEDDNTNNPSMPSNQTLKSCIVLSPATVSKETITLTVNHKNNDRELKAKNSKATEHASIITPVNDENNPINCIPSTINYPINNDTIGANDDDCIMKPPTQPIIRGGGSNHPLPHDITDPQFLEKSITYNTPPVPRCAKKLTLKRSELRKLERLKTQTERLNRFLRKYYHDCLPNLPEEEDGQCSPEEKSLCLSILRTHWREVKTSSSGSAGGAGISVDERSKDSDQLVKNLRNNRATDGMETTTPSISVLSSSYRAHHNDRRKTYPRIKPLLPFSQSMTINGMRSNNNNSTSFNSCVDDEDDDSVDWENLRNAAALISYSNDSCLLPIIQEDSAEVSSSTGSNSSVSDSRCSRKGSISNSDPSMSIGESHAQDDGLATAEVCRKRVAPLDDSFLMSSTDLRLDDSLVLLTKESLGLSEKRNERDSPTEFVKISYEISGGENDEEGEEEDEGGSFGIKKLKALKMEPLGDLFEAPASLAEDEGFMSPYPPEVYSPASSSSTFNRFSVSSSGKGSGCTQEEENEHENYDYDEDDYDKDEVEISNFPHTQPRSSSTSSSSSDFTSSEEEGGPRATQKYAHHMKMKRENANYLQEDDKDCNKDETWNSHGCYIPRMASPCGSLSSNSHQSFSVSTSITTQSGQDEYEDNQSHDMPVKKRENGDEDENVVDEESFEMPDLKSRNQFALAFSTPMNSKSTRLPGASLRSHRLKKMTPRRLVRKPPVNSAFSGKGA
jgi:hypothetical protein